MFGREFLSLFANEAEVVEAGMERLRIMGWSYPISAFMDCTIAASRGLGKSVVPTVIVILGSCVFRVVWVYTIFCLLRHYHVALSALQLLVDDNRRRGDHLFPPQLSAFPPRPARFRHRKSPPDGGVSAETVNPPYGLDHAEDLLSNLQTCWRQTVCQETVWDIHKRQP